jgi:hypothetical protein
VDLDEFTRVSKSAGWSLADDRFGFHMYVDAALLHEKASFHWQFEPADTIKTLVFEIEWIGEGATLSDINRDFFRLCGRFVESSQYISRVVEKEHVVYDVVAGDRKHGHVAKFVVTGPRAAEVAKGYAKLVRENRNLR